MEVHVFLQVLLIILLTARVFAEFAVRLKSPSVIGELVAGVVLGPSLLGWIEPFEAIKLLAEIGIILLLFEVGLKTDITKLTQSGWKSIIVAIGGFVLPFMLGFTLSYGVFGLSLLVSLFIGGTLTATSIGITVRVLSDLKVQHGHEGQIVLGAAVLDDIFGVVLLALLYEFAIGGGVSMINVGKVLLFIGIFFALAPIAAKLISVFIKRLDRTTEVPGLIPTMMVSLVLFFAWLAKVVGAPEMLGGFAAGLALSRRFFLPFGAALHADPKFALRIEELMKPIIHLFTPIFFVMVGLSLNLREIDWGSFHIWGLSLALFVAAVAGKFAGAFVISEAWASRFIIGVAMIPRGEVGLIFAELGRVSGVLENETYAALIIVIVLTTLLPPLVMKGFYNSRHSERLNR
ncbi:MAG: cation:proton antiporter [Rhodospirillaceae bacterium]|nr:cation:proton antiporter [Rhodospirillaceae bacterium]